jgi:hypothetical protein
MVRVSSIVLILGLAPLAGALPDEAPAPGGLDFFGSLYADAGGFYYLSGNEIDSAVFSGATVLNIKFRNVNRSRAKVEGDFEALLPYGGVADLYASAVRSTGDDSIKQKIDQEITGYSERVGMGKTPFLVDMRKMYLEAYLPFADIALGRQIINFGKGLIFSPIDAFSTVQFMDLNFRRNGSDVASARVPLGDLAGIDCIVEAPFGNNEHSTAAKVFATIAGWDVNMVGLYRHRSGETVAGASFKGDALAGVYGELVEHFVNGIDDQYFECMTGADYSIHNIWFFSAEYYFNDRPGGMPHLWGRHNIYASVQFAPNELMRLSLIGISQIDERRTIGMMAWYYSLLQNADLTVYVRGYDTMQGIGAPDAQCAARIEVSF